LVRLGWGKKKTLRIAFVAVKKKLKRGRTKKRRGKPKSQRISVHPKLVKLILLLLFSIVTHLSSLFLLFFFLSGAPFVVY
jgi:hypothetical protein